MKSFFGDQKIIKFILNLWTILTMGLFCLDFFVNPVYDAIADVSGVIYLGILGIYAGEKELSRWKTNFRSQYVGEFFVVVWTILMAIFVLTAAFSKNTFAVPEHFPVVYTTVVGIFALSRHSRELREESLPLPKN